MELQLGLALPTHPSNSKPLDLNSCAYDLNSKDHKKRSFSQLFEHADTDQIMLPTLSLLPLTPITKNDGNDVETVVGWPPLNSFRKKLRYDNYGEEVAGNDQMVWIHRRKHGHDYFGPRGSNTLYIKVKMEGVGIARKVNLRMYHSFQTLKETLMDMFGKCHQHSNCYELAYQDREGDWLLADDVPWRQVHPGQVSFSVHNGSSW